MLSFWNYSLTHRCMLYQFVFDVHTFFSFWQRSRIQVWLYEQINMRIEGCIIVSEHPSSPCVALNQQLKCFGIAKIALLFLEASVLFVTHCWSWPSCEINTRWFACCSSCVEFDSLIVLFVEGVIRITKCTSDKVTVWGFLYSSRLLWWELQHEVISWGVRLVFI